MASDASFTGGRPENAPRKPLVRSYPTIRTVSALMMREMTTRFGRTPGGVIWVVLQPLATILVLGFAFSLIARTPALGTSYIFFKATGLLPFNAFKSISNMVGRAFSFSSALLVYPGVTWVDALLARLFLNALVSFLVTFLILGGIILFQDLSLIIDWGPVLLAMLLASFLGFGIGVLNCYLFERIAIWSNIWGIMTAPLMIVSGVIMLYEAMPTIAQQYLWYNPVLHIAGLMREGFYSTYQPTYVSIPYVLICALVPMALGLVLLRRYHRDLLNR